MFDHYVFDHCVFDHYVFDHYVFTTSSSHHEAHVQDDLSSYTACMNSLCLFLSILCDIFEGFQVKQVV